MTRDIIAETGYLFLGSRMKRLAERLQADALRIFREAGNGDLQPAYCAVLAALDIEDRVPVNTLVEQLGISQPAVTRSVTGMKDQGLVTLDADPSDQRIRLVTLTNKGRALIANLRLTAWRHIRDGAQNLSSEVEGDVLSMLDTLEDQLAEASLGERSQPNPNLSIVDYSPELANRFYRINEEWISSMFVMEDTDKAVLSDPDGQIIEKGGRILFVRSKGNGIIGTGALMPVDDQGSFELTKMGVLSKSRGEKAGEFLLAALINLAKEIGARKLFLLTNAKCEAAIHLYEKLGFRHDKTIGDTYAVKYQRCDVAMIYPLPEA